MEKVAYGGWPNCVRLTNGQIELIATTDVGPRIIRLGFVGGENMFHEDPSQMGKTGGDEWMGFGGHRLWHAPEAKPRTYFPDNQPIKAEMVEDILRLIQYTEPTTGLQKEIDVTLDEETNHVNVLHKIRNTGLWAIEVAPWVLSVMHGGGQAIIPNEPYAPHPDIPDVPGQKGDPRYYLPQRAMMLWSYTKLGDPRYEFTDKYTIVKQDPNAARPQKIGMSNTLGWGAYTRNNQMFVKVIGYEEGEIYPDGGCNYEIFTNSDMLELETLGPMTVLEPGESVDHEEDWYLFDNVSFENTDAGIDANVLSKVKKIL
jgi:hypothetical protein